MRIDDIVSFSTKYETTTKAQTGRNVLKRRNFFPQYKIYEYIINTRLEKLFIPESGKLWRLSLSRGSLNNVNVIAGNWRQGRGNECQSR